MKHFSDNDCKKLHKRMDEWREIEAEVHVVNRKRSDCLKKVVSDGFMKEPFKALAKRLATPKDKLDAKIREHQNYVEAYQRFNPDKGSNTSPARERAVHVHEDHHEPERTPDAPPAHRTSLTRGGNQVEPPEGTGVGQGGLTSIQPAREDLNATSSDIEGVRDSPVSEADHDRGRQAHP